MSDHLVLKRNRINKVQIFMKFLRNLGKNRLRVVSPTYSNFWIHHWSKFSHFGNCSYDSTTGQFTVPPGGDGLYYFYAHFGVNAPKLARLDMRRNGGVFCVVREDERNGNDIPASSCGAVVTLVEGSTVLHFLCLEFVWAHQSIWGGGTVTL